MNPRDDGPLNAHERFLVDLVGTPSVSGHEQAAAECFVRRAASLGFDTRIDEAGNAVAERGDPAAPTHIVLLGHIDTVPGDIPVRVEDGVLHGRGSVDAKGPLAAMLAGASEADLPPDARLSVIGAVGEETAGSPGARHLVARMSPSACIIGEPSGWRGVTLGYKGRLLVTATAVCSNHHSAGPDPSAADRLIEWWTRAVGVVSEFNVSRERAFDQVQATVQDMDHSHDGMTQRASLTAGFRLGPDMGPAALREQLETIAGDAITLEFTGAESASVTHRGDLVVRALSGAIREEGERPRHVVKTGTADLNVVAPVWRCPIAAYGPGDSSLDHTPEERLELDEFRRSIRVIARAIPTIAESVHAVPGREDTAAAGG